jgi:hypothetical protein
MNEPARLAMKRTAYKFGMVVTAARDHHRMSIVIEWPIVLQLNPNQLNRHIDHEFCRLLTPRKV